VLNGRFAPQPGDRLAKVYMAMSMEIAMEMAKRIIESS
jgi:hypothetical protein